MVKGHHVQLKCPTLLFCNFKWFNIKAATVHYCVIQKEMLELHAMGPIDSLTGGAGFYSNVFVVPENTGGL